jgi:hypothetical protein
MHQPAVTPAVHSRLRWLQALATVGMVAAALVASAAGAAAHEGHGPLPEGFRAEVAGVVDGDGAAAQLPGVAFAVEPDGIGVTVTNTGDQELVVAGEQAGEPLLRLTAAAASVNAASPQAVDVEGASVDPEAAASLMDLVWERVEPQWVALPSGGSVTFIDHRAAPAHVPDRGEFATGDVAGEWRMDFTHDGVPYTVDGRIVAVDVPGGAVRIALGLLAAAALLVGATIVRARRRRTGAPAAVDPEPDRVPA